MTQQNAKESGDVNDLDISIKKENVMIKITHFTFDFNRI